MERFFLALFLFLMPALSFGQVFVRVANVGAGLCCVAVLPGGHYMIHDGGNYADHGKSAMEAVEAFIPRNRPIDLMVLSHADADHHGALADICKAYTVKQVIRDGHPGETKTWKDSDTAIRNEVTTEGCKDNNLKDVTLKPGTPFKIGDVTVVFACGFYDLPDDWQLTKDNEKINARSVVVRLDYAGKSILFAGGTVGRHIGDRADTCIAAEKFMIDKDCKVPLHSQVLIAPHHGADNAGTPRWLRAVSPQYIVFSAGHKFKHPCQIVADRYMDVVPLENIFRTGIGDN